MEAFSQIPWKNSCEFCGDVVINSLQEFSQFWEGILPNTLEFLKKTTLPNYENQFSWNMWENSLGFRYSCWRDFLEIRKAVLSKRFRRAILLYSKFRIPKIPRSISWDIFPYFIDKFMKKFSRIPWKNAPKFSQSFLSILCRASLKFCERILANSQKFPKKTPKLRRKNPEICRNFFSEFRWKNPGISKEQFSKIQKRKCSEFQWEFSRYSLKSFLEIPMRALKNFVEELRKNSVEQFLRISSSEFPGKLF